MGDVVWSDAARRKVAPRRGWDVVPARKGDPKAAHARIAAAFARARASLEKTITEQGVDVARTRAAYAVFQRGLESTLDLREQADAYALVGPKIAWDDEVREGDFVRYWCGVAGVDFALRALAAAHRVKTRAAPSGGAAPTLALDVRFAPEEPWWRRRGDDELWRALRHEVLLASDRTALEMLAESLRKDAEVETCAALAAALERSDWGASDRERIATTKKASDHASACAWPLVLLVPTIDDVMPAATKLGGNAWGAAHGLEPIRFDLVARFGAEAAPLLIELTTTAMELGADRVRAFAEAAALVVSPLVAETFAKQLASKELRAIATEYLQMHPSVSVALLANGATHKGPLGDASRAVLKPIVASADPAVAAAKTSLGPAALAVVAAIEAASAPKEEADPSELPAVLREPPWKRKAKPAVANVVTDLAPLPYHERVAWKRGEREGMKNETGWHAPKPEDATKILAAIRAASAGAIPTRSWERTSGALFAQLPSELAVAAFNEARHDRFDWSYATTPQILVARHELAVVPGVLALAASEPAAAVEALLRVDSPRVAPLMADAWVRLKKSRAYAAEWLLAFPEAATIGLIPLAVGPAGKAKSSAERALRMLAARGHDGIVRGVAERYGAEALAATTAVLAFDPLLVLPKKIPTLPAFFAAAAFERPLLRSTKALPLAAVETLGTMLALTPADEPYAGILHVKEACEPRSLAAFAYDLFESWLVAGAPSKEQWAMSSLALLGDDAVARRITPLIRAWPGESAHARAVSALDVLAGIGTDVALMHLHGIAQKVKFKGLQEKAREKIDAIAEARGLTADELADRLVPDLGLDDDGKLTLDFGPRRFEVVFDEGLKPSVVGDGKRGELPKPKQSDDAEKAKAATATWKALKKDAKTLATGQILRLEVAMCRQRRWSREVFDAFLLRHPVLVHLVRRLVWGVYDDAGALTKTFRVAEDSSLADVNDEPTSLASDALVGLVHRLEMDDVLAAKWGQAFSDYEILQPFEQLGRAAALPTAEEKDATELARVTGIEVPTGKVLGLDARGWRRGPPQDAGVTCWYEKPVQGGLVAILDLEPGIFTGMIAESPKQTLGTTSVARGEGWSREGRIALGALPPIVFSELVRDLESLRG